ncbi:hypothetical protein [Amycolatopsis cihanbeyliensis]|uniref:Uncharacterized protein n=1 Tax=Amycolatopsis cihanbeyliensis TaxID=1128664 RepID=A0A542DJX5_AMYCI|nr:hypothetical protein [Amycolatopsis cihanbeyliensis]TQJ03235.1 hypothetical protein FB471_2987 [Amycolatopsis cihanbeyliensis]
MGHVAEQRPDEQPGPEGQPAGDPTPAGDLEPARRAGPPAPVAMDPEQFRQFQQFQQFQDFLRYQEAQQQAGTLVPDQGQGRPPVPPPPPGQLVPTEPPEHRRPQVPRWVRWLGKKLIGWLIFFLLLALALTWAYNYLFGSDDEGLPAHEMGGGTYKTNEILSSQPYEAVRQVYDAIAQEDPRTGKPLVDQACGRFAEATQAQFAANMGYPDCRQAVLALHEQVTHVNNYAESMPSHRSEPIRENTVRISSCADSWDGIHGGPALGAFTLTKVEKGQWLITGHRTEPRPCPAPTDTAPTPTS